MSKTLEIHYSQQSDGFVEGRAYANPRFFSTPRSDAVKVFIYGDWPNIEAAYLARGVPVERVDPRPAVVAEVVKAPLSVATAESAAAAVIPADWRNLKWQQLRSLAASVSPTPVTNSDQAKAAIAAELVKRAKAQGWVDGEPSADQAEAWVADVIEHRRREEPQEALGGRSIREAHDIITKAGGEWTDGSSVEELAELLQLAEA